uniref:Putative secreted protein n=1 Tax=Nyssomyia neivai TaxID=330878 RepID=A0A1L8DNF7_9DIPT
MKTFWIFAVLFGIFAIVAALPASGEYNEQVAPEESPPQPDDVIPEYEVEDLESPGNQGGSDSWGSKINVIDVPLVCPEGHLIDHNGKCREIW